MNKKYFLSAILLCLFVFPKYVFAANKVITKQFDWQIYETEHFNIYFYDEGKNILLFFADTLEKTYRNTTAKLDIEIPEKMPIFLFIGHNDFEQSNVTDIGEGTGGVTEAFKNRLALYYSGSKSWLQYLTEHEFGHEAEFSILFGGFWKSARLIKFPFYPNWLMEGFAEYNTKELGATEREMYLRDATISNKLIPLMKLHNFGHVKPHQVTLAYKESNALMQFIEQEYGSEKIKQLLEAYKEKFDPNSVLLETTGITIDVLDAKFQEYLEDKYAFSNTTLEEPEKYGKRISKSRVYNDFNTNPVFLPDNKKIVYITDRNGYEEIVTQDIESGKTKTIIGRKNIDFVENISRGGKGLAVSADGSTLVFLGERKQKDYIYVYDLVNNHFKSIDTGFEIINSADISADGKKILFIALQSGYDNIYTCDTEGRNVMKVFGGFEDVSDAVFSKDCKFIVFSKESKTASSDKPYQKDLYMLNLEDNNLEQLTDFANDEFSPCISPDNETVVFVSDKEGINDLYSLNVRTKEIEKLTNIVGGNFTPSFSNDGKLLVFSSFRKGAKHIYISEFSSFENKPIFYSKLSQQVLPEKQRNLPVTFRQYKFYPSTDLFFPMLYYSSTEGLYVAMYWQLSEMLGEHSATVYTQYASGSDYLDYGLSYTFLKFRPQFFFNFQGQGGYIDWDIHRTVHSQLAGISYPLNRYNSVSLAFQNSLNIKVDKTNPENLVRTVTKDHACQIALSRSTLERKYIQVIRGSRFNIVYGFGTDIFGADYIYKDTIFEYSKYFPIGKEQTIANRIFGVTSIDRDKHDFKLIRFDRVRMYSDQNSQVLGSNLLVYNLEWRFPIVYDINYYTAFMFPDFLFRSFYGVAFADAGVVSDDTVFKGENFRNSYGIGFEFDTFILQMYYFPMNFYFCYSPINDKYEYFFNLGSVF